jgi:hypothetical protein
MGWAKQQVADYESRRKLNLPSRAALPHAEQCERPQTLARCHVRKTQGAGLLHCRFTLRRKSLLDVDAKYASTKDLLDCLVFSGLIPGDKEGQITLEVVQQKIGRGEVEQTVVEIVAL